MTTAINTSDPSVDRVGDCLGWAIQASLLDERFSRGAVLIGDWNSRPNPTTE
jgi:hypothetical protein